MAGRSALNVSPYAASRRGVQGIFTGRLRGDKKEELSMKEVPVDQLTSRSWYCSSILSFCRVLPCRRSLSLSLLSYKKVTLPCGIYPRCCLIDKALICCLGLRSVRPGPCSVQAGLCSRFQGSVLCAQSSTLRTLSQGTVPISSSHLKFPRGIL